MKKHSDFFDYCTIIYGLVLLLDCSDSYGVRKKNTPCKAICCDIAPSGMFNCKTTDVEELRHYEEIDVIDCVPQRNGNITCSLSANSNSVPKIQQGEQATATKVAIVAPYHHKGWQDQSYEVRGCKEIQMSVIAAISANYGNTVSKVDKTYFSGDHAEAIINVENQKEDSFYKLQIEGISLNNNKSHSRKKEYLCPECNKKFRSPPQLKTHMQSHGYGDHPCPKCNKKFSAPSQLKRHMQSHGYGDHPCPKCGKLFASRSNLKVHMQSHGIGDYPCLKCNKKSGSQSQLKIHMQSHGYGDHPCPKCGKLFASRSNLKVHMQSHGIGDYPCLKCNKKFGNQSQLKIHMQSHRLR